MKKQMQLMFVCSGNTCRSPMAEHLFKYLCKSEGLNINVVSRGAYVTKDSSQAQPEAIESTLKVDQNSAITSLIPKQLSLFDIVNSNLILTMSENHKEDVINIAVSTYFDMFKDKKTKSQLENELTTVYTMTVKKTFTLKEINNQTELDISDPYDKILTPAYKAYVFLVSKIKDDKTRQKIVKLTEKYFGKIKFLPNCGPLKTYKARAYDECRDEILKNLELLIKKLKQ